MRTAMTFEKAKVTNAEATRRLHSVPLPLLRAVAAQLQEELQQERLGLLADQHEWSKVTKRVADATKELAAAQKCAAARERQTEKALESLARTEQLLAAAAHKRTELETAIVAIQREISRITAPCSSPAASARSVQFHRDGGARAVNPHCSSRERHRDLSSDSAPIPVDDRANRAAAAAQQANYAQQCAAAQYRKEQQVLQLERENRVMQHCVEVLRRGDASSARLYHTLVAGSKETQPNALEA
ncbi:hypothetical protein ABB37_03548 [Leptomonas pyrrhocoris]|uniref:Uncharacterized protein n=1 Tax=Leptomonas pyrrhocoris TaxID=157538 RepID=A0A0N1J516_LEPPY|nr:hypothetical protein ABB37_03548 [Leptomonas pyrrhocoris]KPA82494.1 hypothetical protein ABB37_03548 [Leptomonas pyrrhocoris]|eukprot:XP_015660933.1 hypothetical protein ABB37_03548 [Leptomonas pyrrhocoris]